MKKHMYIIGLCLMVLVGLTGCQTQVEEAELCQDQHFVQLQGDDGPTAQDGFENSYYYNLDGKYRIKLELQIKHEDIVIDTIEIEKEKKDYHIIDGTFGVSAKRDVDGHTITWTIRQDEEIAQTVTEDFYGDVTGENNHLSKGGLIYKAGVSPCKFAYDVDNVVGDEIKYDWSVSVKLYGTKLEPEIVQ